jgi:hypothetical protein
MLYDKRWDKKAETKPATAALIAARKLIENPENWCQKHFQYGGAFCVFGALSQATMGAMAKAHGPALDYLNVQCGNCIPRWNDAPRRTHAEVLAMYDAAIAASTDC